MKKLVNVHKKLMYNYIKLLFTKTRLIVSIQINSLINQKARVK